MSGWMNWVSLDRSVHCVDTLSYQLYINRKGIPLGNDYNIYQDNPSDGVLALSYYYQYDEIYKSSPAMW